MIDQGPSQFVGGCACYSTFPHITVDKAVLWALFSCLKDASWVLKLAAVELTGLSNAYTDG